MKISQLCKPVSISAPLPLYARQVRQHGPQPVKSPAPAGANGVTQAGGAAPTTSISTSRTRGLEVPSPGYQGGPLTWHTLGDSAGTDQAVVQRGNARRAVVSFFAAGWLASAAAPASAEGVASDLARRVLRPADLDEVQAVVALLDARSTLRDIAALAATGPESKERFDGRKLWPAYARWLREAGPAAPTVARLVTGSTDGEDTLSEMYGGKAELPGATDAVYRGLGRVLTISGRTIRPEAQESPEAALEAKAALDTFLAKVPQQVYEQAMAFRVARAQKLGQQ